MYLIGEPIEKVNTKHMEKTGEIAAIALTDF
jgi:hypothetical protein